MNSRDKGKRGERLWRDVLRAAGYLKAIRGQQFAGGAESPDVICEELAHTHFEVKFVENLNVRKAMEQAARDAGPNKHPVVAHKTSRADWLVTLPKDTYFALLHGDLTTPPSGPTGSTIVN